jgi:UDP-N-acetylmuramoyl-L-alanyl-D-glutamate--2,6-diaminopimelate ligase
VYGNPADRLLIVGVTGTNGKTTTSHLTWSALGAAGRRAGLVGTVGNRFGDWSDPARLTTPDAPLLQRTLASMVANGADSVVMEVSSQGLDQERVGGIGFSVAVWLNLGHDHLDYHGTMEQYYAAKASLFDPRRARFGVVCVDDQWGRRLAHQAQIPVVTFGRSDGAQVRVEVLSSGLDGTQIRILGAGRALRRAGGGATDAPDELLLRSPVVGEMNAENMAAAYLTACALGAPSDDAVAGLAFCPAIPGRFDLVDGGQPFLVIVDYAHTPEAYGRLITTARGLSGEGGEVHLVVGCRGDKDRFKRPLTGRVAATADHPVLTTDDPGDEDPRAILDQVLVGTLDVPHDHVRVEPDRKAAIGLAIGSARPGDVVLIVGRGHERRRRFGPTSEDFDDREVAARALAENGFEHVDTYQARPTPLLPDR